MARLGPYRHFELDLEVLLALDHLAQEYPEEYSCLAAALRELRDAGVDDAERWSAAHHLYDLERCGFEVSVSVVHDEHAVVVGLRRR